MKDYKKDFKNEKERIEERIGKYVEDIIDIKYNVEKLIESIEYNENIMKIQKDKREFQEIYISNQNYRKLYELYNWPNYNREDYNSDESIIKTKKKRIEKAVAEEGYKDITQEDKIVNENYEKIFSEIYVKMKDYISDKTNEIEGFWDLIMKMSENTKEEKICIIFLRGYNDRLKQIFEDITDDKIKKDTMYGILPDIIKIYKNFDKYIELQTEKFKNWLCKQVQNQLEKVNKDMEKTIDTEKGEKKIINTDEAERLTVISDGFKELLGSLREDDVEISECIDYYEKYKKIVDDYTKNTKKIIKDLRKERKVKYMESYDLSSDILSKSAIIPTATYPTTIMPMGSIPSGGPLASTYSGFEPYSKKSGGYSGSSTYYGSGETPESEKAKKKNVESYGTDQY